MKSKNPIVANALKAKAKIARNNIGDCFSEAVFDLEKAAKIVEKNPNSAKAKIAEAKVEISGPYGVMHYDHADKTDKANVSKCVSAIDKAMAKPTVETITAARWECEKARAHSDGGSPRKEFWNSSCRNVATNADTEASIDAEANKLYAQLKDIAKKFDALQSRLTKIKVYFYDYKETADGIRGLHGVMR